MKVLFVCTGNTCRSSMAEIITRSMTNFDVRSAGVAANNGSPASSQAVEVMSRRGQDLSSHRSQPMSSELIEWADLVLTMTRQHKQILLERFPQATSKVYTLKEYVLDDNYRSQLQEQLHTLYVRQDEKRREFGLRRSPNIRELQEKRAVLLQELTEVEQQLAKLQSELRQALLQERADIAQAELQLAGGDVADPFGQSSDVYDSCAEEIEGLLKRAFANHQG